MRSIKTKVIILVVISSVVSSAICGGLSLMETGNISIQNAGRTMATQTSRCSKEIDTTLGMVAQSVDMLAAIAQQSIGDLHKFQTDKAYVQEYTESLRTVALECANNTKGALTYYIRYNPEFTEPTSGIFATRDTEGAAFSQLEPTDFSMYDPDDLEHVGWYYIPVKNGEPTWMDPYLNSNINVHMISYVVPIYKDGVSIGIVGMDIDFGNIEEIARASVIFDTGKSFLLNSSGQIVYHEEIEFGTPLDEVNGGEFASLSAEFSDSRKEGTALEYDYNGIRKIAYYNCLGNGMKFVLSAPVEEMNSEARGILKMILLAVLIAVIFSVLVGFVLSARIVLPIKKITGVIAQIAKLNLRRDERIDRLTEMKDETGDMARAVKEMSERLNGMVAQIEATGRIVYRNAEDLKNSSQVVSEMCGASSVATQELAAAMEEAAVTSENISRNIVTVNENARVIRELSYNGEKSSREILDRAETLRSTTRKAVKRTKIMYEQVQKDTASAMEKSKAVEKINELTDTILKISSQTNLLALNASIEAARAGEAGKGFAVVADQIGDLSSQTQNTVKDINGIIEEVHAAVSSMSGCLRSLTEFLESAVIDDYNEFLRVGKQYAQDAGDFESSMREVSSAVKILGDAIEGITESVGSISSMVNDSSEGISLIAEKTAEIVKKMSDEESMIEVNNENAGKLSAIVGNFAVD